MKRILTAIGNTRLNEILKQKQKYEILAKDIQYKEGILEILNMDYKIDILIISEILDGEIDFKDLINKIIQINEKIEIIVFIEEENIELQSFLYSKGIFKIYINNEIDIDTFIINLEDDIQEKNNELNEEIRKLKEIIKSQEKKYTQEKKRGKVIVITGAYGSGKSIFSCVLCKERLKQGNKILIIDFDIYNSSINILYNVPKYKLNSNSLNLKEQIIQISKREYLLCATDLIFSDQNSTGYINLEEIIQEFVEEYDYIIIDTTSDFKYKYQKRILDLADEIIFLVIPTLSEIKKAKKLYEIYCMDFKITSEKIKIVVNKENNYSVDNLIVSNIFNVNKISGKMKYVEGIETNITNKKIKGNLKIDALT